MPQRGVGDAEFPQPASRFIPDWYQPDAAGCRSVTFRRDQAASVNVTNGTETKGKSITAIGAFPVAFVTADAANAGFENVARRYGNARHA